MYLTYDVFVASWGDDLCCCWRYHVHPEKSRTLHAFEWLMSCVIIEYLTYWICVLVKFVECCDYVDWCVCTLVDFVDDCEWLNYALLHVLLACAYTLGDIYLMIITWIIWSWIIHYVIDWSCIIVYFYFIVFLVTFFVYFYWFSI